MDLNQLVRTVRRHWFVALCAFAFVMTIGIAAAFLPQKQYDANATVLVSPNPKSDPSAAIQAVQIGLPQIAAQVGSRSFGDLVVNSLPAALRTSGTSVATSTAPDSGVLTITASGPNPAATAPIANAYATRVVRTQAKDSLWALTILDRAIVPTAPSTPVKGPILIGAFVLGLVIALLLALLAGSLSKRRRRADELRSQLGASVLAEVPNVPHWVLASDKLWATLNADDAPRLVESLQQLRTNVELAIPHAPEGFVVAITSAGDREGKSTIAANLAWLLASVGDDVVLIDADLRHPSLSRLLQQRPGPGLSAAASGDVSALLQSTRLHTLEFMPAGIPDRHPAEVISTALPRALRALRRPDRIVIVDAPPLRSIAETAMITSIAGAAVLVIDTRQREPEDIEHAVLELEDRRCQLFGIVLNRVRARQTRLWTNGTYGLAVPTPRVSGVPAINYSPAPQIEEPAYGAERQQ